MSADLEKFIVDYGHSTHIFSQGLERSNCCCFIALLFLCEEFDLYVLFFFSLPILSL